MQKVATHIINFYGVATFRRLLHDLKDGRPLSEIAAYLNVSRQRVHQWKQSLGYERVVWEPHPGVLEVTDESERAKHKD